MKGIIAIWSGAVIDIPAGWHLCDGTNGTPDLQDNFVIGAGSTYSVDATGGAASHDHDFTSDGHNHTLVPPTDVGPGSTYGSTISTNTDSGTTDAENCLPPYYALAFIQKL